MHLNAFVALGNCYTAIITYMKFELLNSFELQVSCERI